MGILATVKRVLKIRKQAKNDYVNMFIDLQKQKGVTDNTIISHRHALGSMFRDGSNTNDLNAKLQSSLPKNRALKNQSTLNPHPTKAAMPSSASAL